MRIEVRVIPKAKQNKVESLPNGSLRLRVTAVPEGGKANAAALKLLANYLGVAPSKLRVVKGATSRNKLIELTT